MSVVTGGGGSDDGDGLEKKKINPQSSHSVEKNILRSLTEDIVTDDDDAAAKRKFILEKDDSATSVDMNNSDHATFLGNNGGSTSKKAEEIKKSLFNYPSPPSCCLKDVDPLSDDDDECHYQPADANIWHTRYLDGAIREYKGKNKEKASKNKPSHPKIHKLL